MHSAIVAWLPALIWVALVLGGCGGRYFHDAGKPAAVVTATMSEWPAPEYWTGIVFNGKKIGFSHFQLIPDPNESGTYVLNSEAYFHLRILAADKSVYMRSIDRVDSDLRLLRFFYESEIDDSHIQVTGQRNGARLNYTVSNQGESTQGSLALNGTEPVYPSSAIGLYALLQGLELGRRYGFRVFDPQSQTLETVDLMIAGFESSDLFEGSAYRIQSRYKGRSVTTWMDSLGRPLLEMSMHGTMIAALEEENRARRYLTTAALSKDESLLNYSLIRTKTRLPEPEQIQSLTLMIGGIPDTFTLPADSRQRCVRHGSEAECRIRKHGGGDDEAIPEDLAATFAINAHHPRIEAAAREAVGVSSDDRERLSALLGWMKDHIKAEAVDVFSSLDALDGGRAECQGQALLFAAMARTLNIPTRVVNGIVYSTRHQGFLYHSWNECFLETHWVAVDPVLGQIPADATHLKLIEGHRLQELAPLLDLIGQLAIRIEAAF